MKVRKGYKQTEDGIIPEDWEVKKMGECCSKITDGTHDTPRPIKEGIPFLTAIHVKENYIDFEGCYFLSQIVHEVIYKRCNPERNDVLMVNIGAGVATTALVNVDYEFSLKNVALLKPDNKFLIGPFLNYYQEFSKTRITTSISTGGAQPFLSLSQIGGLNIALPSKLEQTTIATALSDADSLITSLKKLIEKKRAIKQGAMQELLRPKEGWEEKSILQLADNKKELFDDGDWVEAEHITSEGIRLLQTGNIGIGKFLDKEGKKYIFPQSFDKLKCKEIQEGDLLICRLAEPAGRACVLPNIDDEKIITSVDVTIFRPRIEVVNRIFLSYIFSTGRWLNAVSELCGGTTHKRISRGSLGKLKVSIPSNVEEQTHIATILSNIDAEITALEQKLGKYKLIKQGMMQELLTGKIRLV